MKSLIKRLILPLALSLWFVLTSPISEEMFFYKQEVLSRKYDKVIKNIQKELIGFIYLPDSVSGMNEDNYNNFKVVVKDYKKRTGIKLKIKKPNKLPTP